MQLTTRARILLPALVLCLAPGPASGQFAVGGDPQSWTGKCYSLAFASEPEWVDRLERRIYLSDVRVLAPSINVPVFVVRPAPGTMASHYPKVTWLISSGAFRVRWTAGSEGGDGILPFAYFSVSADFPLEPEGTLRALPGVARYSSHTPDPAPAPVQVLLTPVDCEAPAQ
jgi:hypothetical protein